MSRYVDLSNPKIFHNGRDKFGNGIYHIPPDLPTVDLVERKRGKWIPHKSIFGGLGERVYTCNQCGYNIGFHTENFCPSCGADMRKPMTIPKKIIDGVLGYDD